MTDTPETTTYSARWADDTRAELPLAVGERETLVSMLEWQRETLALKCGGLTPEQMRQASVPPSNLPLQGLVQHMADVERWWFRTQFLGQDVAYRYVTEENLDADFDELTHDPAEVLTAWRDECEHSRQVVAAHSLDDTGTHRRTGGPVSLRWILVHLIEEYSRHSGHADLLRERIDGRTGY